MGILNDLLHINGEIAHWLFEAEGLLIGVAWHWLWQRRHDRLRHAVGPCSMCSEGHTYEGNCELRTGLRPWTKDMLEEQVAADVADIESISGVHPIQRGSICFNPACVWPKPHLEHVPLEAAVLTYGDIASTPKPRRAHVWLSGPEATAHKKTMCEDINRPAFGQPAEFQCICGHHDLDPWGWQRT